MKKLQPLCQASVYIGKHLLRQWLKSSLEESQRELWKAQEVNDQKGIAAAIQEAEKMLRETNNVHEFNARLRISRGLSSLLQKSQRSAPNDVNVWRDNEYQRAKLTIEPSGEGLGKDFLRNFLPQQALAATAPCKRRLPLTTKSAGGRKGNGYYIK